MFSRGRSANREAVVADLPHDGGLSLSKPPQRSRQLDRAEAMRLLASVSYGRVVFTQNALPAIRPVNHLIDDDRVIIRTRLTAKISAVVQSNDAAIVAYEADSFDPESQTGWSVVITGRAHIITDPDQITRYEQLLHPWVNHADIVLAIEPQLVTGLHIIATEADGHRPPTTGGLLRHARSWLLG
jgi:Pyridoxamine 5'-phosphate oxidase